MDTLLEILEDIQPDVDYDTCTTLIDDRILDSFAILSLVADIEDNFEVKITPEELTAENFNSAEAMWNLIERLQK